MGYIDAHVHVWTDDYRTYPFAAGHDPAKAVPRTFFPEDILGHARPCGVDRIVLVQMSYYHADNRYMLKVMADHPGVFAGIGIVEPTAEAPDRAMVSLAAEGVYGFRVYGGVPADTWCDGPGFERMFAAGERHRLAICPLVGPDLLPALARRCQQFPDAPVIIDHLGLIGAGGAPMRDADVEALCGMARFPQVMVKASAFYALGARKPPYRDLAGLIRRVVDAFGPQRLMWASDAPYQVQGEHTYAASVALIAEGLDFLSAADRDQILRGTAEAFFFRR